MGPLSSCQATFCAEFRAWTGVNHRADRSLQKIRDDLLKRDINAVQPELNKLKVAIKEVQASAWLFPGAQIHLDGALSVEESGYYYKAVADAIVNMVVKPARKYPGDLLKAGLAKCFIGMGNQGYWLSDETVSESAEADLHPEKCKNGNKLSEDCCWIGSVG